MSVEGAKAPDVQHEVIVCGRGKRGKALTDAIVRQITQHGVAYVAALSDVGAEHVARVGQTVANSMGVKVTFDPQRGEIEVAPGHRRLALIVEIKVENDGSDDKVEND